MVMKEETEKKIRPLLEAGGPQVVDRQQPGHVALLRLEIMYLTKKVCRDQIKAKGTVVKEHQLAPREKAPTLAWQREDLKLGCWLWAKAALPKC